MIGAEYLRDIRRQGLKPSIVFVMAFKSMRSDGLYHPDTKLENGSHAEIHIEPDDNIAALDFRFLTGCVVAINSDCKEKARLLYKYIKPHRPQSVTVSGSDFLYHEAK